MQNEPDSLVVVFDAECLLCNGWVQFILKHDTSRSIRFASMQGKTGKALLLTQGLSVDHLETLLVEQRGQFWQHTDAVLKILGALGWPWKLANVAKVIPHIVRDPAYRLLARNRYAWFGKSAECLLPNKADAHRFMD